MINWRNRMGEEQLQALLQESLAVAISAGAMGDRHHVIRVAMQDMHFSLSWSNQHCSPGGLEVRVECREVFVGAMRRCERIVAVAARRRSRPRTSTTTNAGDMAWKKEAVGRHKNDVLSNLCDRRDHAVRDRHHRDAASGGIFGEFDHPRV